MEKKADQPVVQYGKRKYTIEEYLAFEARSDVKHEYYQGEIFAMAAATLDHNFIVANMLGTIKQHLKGKGCYPFGSDLRIYVQENGLFTYPDLSINCGDIKTLNDDNLNVLNPSVLIEVLSPSTRQYYRIDKFSLYRAIPTLREYILADTATAKIESWYINAANHWELQEYKGLAAALHIQTIDLTIPFKDIYEGTELGGYA